MALAAYLKNTKRDLSQSLESPKPVHIVIGNESCDLDSVVCAVVYAFFLHSTSKGPNPPSVVPVLNLSRHHYRLRLEVNAHLTSLGILPQDHLVFIDDPDLDLAVLTSRSDGALLVTLVDHHQMSQREECLRPFVIDVMDHRPVTETFPDSWQTEIEPVGSCSSLVTHRIMDHGSFTVDPVSAQLLLGAVLADTGNMSEADDLAREKDKSAVSRLERSLPAKVTCQGIFDFIKKVKFDLSVLTVGEMLMKDLKVVRGNHITVAISSVTMELETVLSRVEFSQHACAFCKELPADVLVIMTLIMGATSISQRCVAIYSENRVYREQITDVLLRAASPNLGLQHLDLSTTPYHVTAFNQSNLKISRKGVLPLISEFLSGEANTPEEESSGANNNNSRNSSSSRGKDNENNENSDSSRLDAAERMREEDDRSGGGGGGSGGGECDDGRTEEEDVFCEMQMRRHINMAKIAQSDHFRTSQDVFDLAAVGTRSVISPSLSSDSACDFDSLEGSGGGMMESGGVKRNSRNSSLDGGEGSGARKVSNSSMLSSQMAEMERREKEEEVADIGEGDSVTACGVSHDNFDKDSVDNMANNNVAESPVAAGMRAEETLRNQNITSNNSNNPGNNVGVLNLNQSSRDQQLEDVPSYPETPPNSYCMSPVVGQDTVRQTHLPSFNSKEMVERIHEKKKAMAMRNSSGSGSMSALGRLGLESSLGGGGAVGEGSMMTSSASASEFGPNLTVFGMGSGLASSGGAGSSLMSPVVPQNSYMSCTDIAGTYGQIDSPTSDVQGNATGSDMNCTGDGRGGGVGVDIPRLARAGIEEKVIEKRSHFNTWSSSSPGAGDFSGGPYTPQNSYANSSAGSMMNLAENLTSLNSAEVVAKIRAKQAAMFGNCSSRASASSEDSLGGCRSPGPATKSRGISMESPIHAFTPQNSYKDGLGLLDAKGRLTDLNEVVERLETGGVSGGGEKRSSNSGGDSRDEDAGGVGGGADVLSVVGGGGGIGAAGRSGGVGSARHSSSQSDSQNTMSDVESLLSMSLDYVGTPASDTGSGSVSGGGIHTNIVASGLAGAMRSEFTSSASASATPKDDVFTPGGLGSSDHKSKVVFGFNHVTGGVAANGEEIGMVVGGGGAAASAVNGVSNEGTWSSNPSVAVNAPPNSIADNGVLFNLMTEDGGVVVGVSRSNSELFSPLNESNMMEDEIEMFQAAEDIVSQSIAAAALQMNDGEIGCGDVWKLVNGETDQSSGAGSSRSDGGCSGAISCAEAASGARICDIGNGDNDNADDEDCTSSISNLTSPGVSSIAERDRGSVSFAKSEDEKAVCRSKNVESSSSSSSTGAKRHSVGFNMGSVGDGGSGKSNRSGGKKRVSVSEPEKVSSVGFTMGVENGLHDDEDEEDSGCAGLDKNDFVNSDGKGREEEEGLTDAALSELAYEWARDLIQGVLENFPNDELSSSSSIAKLDGDGFVNCDGVENGDNDGGVDEEDDEVCDGGEVPSKGYSAVPRLSIVITDNQGVDMDGLAELAKMADGGGGGGGRGGGGKEGDEEDEEDVDGFSVEALDGSVGDIYREDTVDLDEEEEGVEEEGEDGGNNEEFDNDADQDGNDNEKEMMDLGQEEFSVGVEEVVGMSKGGNVNNNPIPSSCSRKSSKSSSSSFDSSSSQTGIGGERKWSRDMDVAASTIKENEVVTSFPERRCSSEVRFHDILEDYDDSPITSFPGRKISISEDYPRRFSREDSTRRQPNLATDSGEDANSNKENESGNENDNIVKSDLETEYLPNMDPLHGNLDIVTSNEASFSTMTDSGREVVEGESFRRVSGHELPTNDELGIEQTAATPSPSASSMDIGLEGEEGMNKDIIDDGKPDFSGLKKEKPTGSSSDEKKALGERKKKASDDVDISAFSIGTGDSQEDDDEAFCQAGGGEGGGAPLTPPAVSEIKKAKKKIRVSFSHDIADDELEYLAQVSSPRALKSPPPPVSPSAGQMDGSRKDSADDDLDDDMYKPTTIQHFEGEKGDEDESSDDDFELDPSVMRGAREVYLTSAGRISIAGEEEEGKCKGRGVGDGQGGVKMLDSVMDEDPVLEYDRIQVGGLIELAENAIRCADNDIGVLSSSSTSSLIPPSSSSPKPLLSSPVILLQSSSSSSTQKSSTSSSFTKPEIDVVNPSSSSPSHTHHYPVIIHQSLSSSLSSSSSSFNDKAIKEDGPNKQTIVAKTSISSISPNDDTICDRNENPSSSQQTSSSPPSSSLLSKRLQEETSSLKNIVIQCNNKKDNDRHPNRSDDNDSNSQPHDPVPNPPSSSSSPPPLTPVTSSVMTSVDTPNPMLPPTTTRVNQVNVTSSSSPLTHVVSPTPPVLPSTSSSTLSQPQSDSNFHSSPSEHSTQAITNPTPSNATPVTHNASSSNPDVDIVVTKSYAPSHSPSAIPSSITKTIPETAATCSLNQEYEETGDGCIDEKSFTFSMSSTSSNSSAIMNATSSPLTTTGNKGTNKNDVTNTTNQKKKSDTDDKVEINGITNDGSGAEINNRSHNDGVGDGVGTKKRDEGGNNGKRKMMTKKGPSTSPKKMGVLDPVVKLTHDPLRLGHSQSGTSLCSIKGAEYRDEWQDDDIQDVAGIRHDGMGADQPRKKIVPDPALRDDIGNDEDDDDDDVIVENPENDLEWENDTPITHSSTHDVDSSGEDLPRYRTVQASGSLFEMDMELVSPYKAVLAHGGYYDEGLTAIIVFYGYHLPHRRQDDYRTVMNHLFHHVINILDELVADDYVIVYFHGSTPRQQMPGFNWLRRCYRCIDRRLKKNLKGLFLVHPTLWLRTVVAMTKPFISSKFSSKLKFVRDLQELKSLVPLENLTIPPAVLHYDRYRQHLPSSPSSSPLHQPTHTTTTSSSPLTDPNTTNTTNNTTSPSSHPHTSSSSPPSSSSYHHQPTSTLLHASSSSSPPPSTPSHMS